MGILPPPHGGYRPRPGVATQGTAPTPPHGRGGGSGGDGVDWRARAEIAEAAIERVRFVVDGKAGGFAQAVRDALYGVG